MNMVWPDDRTVITRLRVRSAGLDPLTVQQRMARSLNMLSLHPSGLSPAAILCIRSLRDPKPSSVRLQRNDARPPPEWERALNAVIGQLAGEAARPIDSPVPANAQAVLFRDRSELLACLAADWCAGQVTAQWWWQSLLRHRDLDDALINAWLETPEYIPMALHQLDKKRSSILFMQKLSDDDTKKIVNMLAQTFGLHELSSLINQNTANDSPHLQPAKKTSRSEISDKSVSATVQASPWRNWTQNSSIERLSLDRQLLLGVGLMLYRAPSIVRTASFAKQVKVWRGPVDSLPLSGLSPESRISIPARDRPTIAAKESPSEPEELAESLPVAGHLPTEASPEQAAALTGKQMVEKNENFPLDQIEMVVGQKAVAIASQSSLLDTASRSPMGKTSIRQKDVLPTDVDGETPKKTSKTQDVALPIIENEVPAMMDQRTNESPSYLGLETHEENIDIEDIVIHSKFGGICYFINLGLYLDLYSDFTQPLHPGIELPIWDFVALLAQQFIGDEVIRDPIWSLLAKLAGRKAEEPPGARVAPSGYESLAAWLNELMLTVRPRLQLALGVKNEELPRFFTQPADIVMTPTRLDIYFALNDLAIEIRMSGLDRNPGWVPAAGRFIGFHYE